MTKKTWSLKRSTEALTLEEALISDSDNVLYFEKQFHSKESGYTEKDLRTLQSEI